MERPLTFVLLGAGARGRGFATWLHDEIGPGSVVAVAEPNLARRARIQAQHGIPDEGGYVSWQALLDGPRLADVAINTTMDREHLGSAVAAMRTGYHMMLEKPMATSLEDCCEIDRVRRETGRIVSVCHSLRYHAVYAEVRRILRAGTIGEVVSLDQLEGVEHVHQAHSFVRGNWANEGRSSSMLLQKSCHDLDIIADLVDLPCERVSSFGSLNYFRPENAPPGAPDRCVQGCPAAAKCPYYAPKVYADPKGWARSVGLDGLSPTELRDALATSPYGRCVFHADNDVVDHQVVAMEFEGGVTATLTMTAFTPFGGRRLRIHGTKGYLEARLAERTIDVWEFWEGNRHSHIELPPATGTHGGADAEVMRRLVEAIRMEDPASVPTSTHASLQSHAIVFAAERSRRTGQSVRLADLDPVTR